MDMGNPRRQAWGCLLWLCLIGWVAPATAQTLSLARLDAEAPTRDVVSGSLDHRFVAAERAGVIFEPDAGSRWWRITSAVDVDARSQPHLVVRAPYQNRM